MHRVFEEARSRPWCLPRRSRHERSRTMAHSARFLAAALLVAALAVPASLHASGLGGPSPAARPDDGVTLRIDSWSFDWLFRFFNQLMPKTGTELHPSGR